MENSQDKNEYQKCLNPKCNAIGEKELKGLCNDCFKFYNPKNRMPQRLAEINFTKPDFKIINPIKNNIAMCKNFFNSQISYFLYGEQGRGKTWLAAGTMVHGLENFKNCLWYNWISIIYPAKLYPYDSQADIDTRLINNMIKPDSKTPRYIFIDDLGNDPENLKERTRMMLYNILNHAEQRGNIFFFITTNKDMKYFAEIDARIADRLSGLCSTCNCQGYMEIKGKSLRFDKKDNI